MIKLESGIRQKTKTDNISKITIQGKLVHQLIPVRPRKEKARKENECEVDFNYVQDVYFKQPKVIVKTQAADGKKKELKFFPDNSKDDSLMTDGGPSVYSVGKMD